MKVIKTLAILIFISISSISYGEILIYKINNKCLEYNGVEDEWEKIVKRDRGFLILELGYHEDGTIDVNDAVEIMYWRDGSDKLYRETDRYINIVRIIQERRLYWLLVEDKANVIEVQSEILKGRAEDNNGDSSNMPDEIVNEFNGKYLSDIQLGSGHYIDIKDMTLRLHSQWTLLANESIREEGNFDYAVSEIVLNYLKDRGYENSIK